MVFLSLLSSTPSSLVEAASLSVTMITPSSFVVTVSSFVELDFDGSCDGFELFCRGSELVDDESELVRGGWDLFGGGFELDSVDFNLVRDGYELSCDGFELHCVDSEFFDGDSELVCGGYDLIHGGFKLVFKFVFDWFLLFTGGFELDFVGSRDGFGLVCKCSEFVDDETEFVRGCYELFSDGLELNCLGSEFIGDEVKFDCVGSKVICDGSRFIDGGFELVSYCAENGVRGEPNVRLVEERSELINKDLRSSLMVLWPSLMASVGGMKSGNGLAIIDVLRTQASRDERRTDSADAVDGVDATLMLSRPFETAPAYVMSPRTRCWRM
ncbi:Uncharacterized protein Rs2_44256 [Raphanus sativus]|nr:Uncharacterized protein Rs2_44256 [Raphanus sativus]